MFEKVKKFYDMNLYTKAQIAQFVAKSKISSEDYKTITGDYYAVG